MNEKDFDQMLQLEDGASNDLTSEKNLYKKMNRQINKRVFKSVILTLLGIFCCVCLLSKICDLTFYNPEKSSPYLDGQDEYSDFNLLMDVYIGLNYPGRCYYPITSSSEHQGFGQYQVTSKIHDSFFPLYMDGQYNNVFEIKRNQLSAKLLSDQPLLTTRILEFYNNSKASDDYNYGVGNLQITQQKIEQVKDLPDSAILKVALSFETSQEMESVLSFIRSYPESRFAWIALDSDERFLKNTYDGINLIQSTGYRFTEETNEKYPSLMLGQETSEWTAQDLEACYTSRLRFLKDNPDFLRLVDTYFHDFQNARSEHELYTARLAEVEKEGLQCIGVYGYVKKQDFLSMVENQEISYADIQDVKLSIYTQ